VIQSREQFLLNTVLYPDKKKMALGPFVDDVIRLLFLHAHRDASALADELPEESDQFRFLRAACCWLDCG
jgi:hypothetical protein